MENVLPWPQADIQVPVCCSLAGASRPGGHSDIFLRCHFWRGASFLRLSQGGGWVERLLRGLAHPHAGLPSTLRGVCAGSQGMGEGHFLSFNSWGLPWFWAPLSGAEEVGVGHWDPGWGTSKGNMPLPLTATERKTLTGNSKKCFENSIFYAQNSDNF